MSESSSFFSIILQASLKAHWGKDFDPELMAVISHLRDAEKFIQIDWDEIAKGIAEGRLTAEFWNKERASADLESAKGDFWKVKNDLALKLGGDAEAFKAIGEHFERFEEWEENQKPEKAEFVFACWAAEILSRRVLPAENHIRRVPTYHEVEELIEGLRHLAKGGNIGSEVAQPVLEAVKMLARSHGPGEEDHWANAYSKQMQSAAEWIKKAGLFSATTIRVDKLLSGSVVRLKQSKDVKGKY